MVNLETVAVTVGTMWKNSSQMRNQAIAVQHFHTDTHTLKYTNTWGNRLLDETEEPRENPGKHVW